jgi:peptidoglycan-associated lipoprotein
MMRIAGRLSVLVVLIGIVALLSGCASKGYVDKQIEAERARTDAAFDQLRSDVQSNKDQLAKLQSLSMEMEKNVDKAINEARGFEDYVVVWEGTIYFDFNSYQLKAEAITILDEAGDNMTTRPTSVMEIDGFTDPQGSADYNIELGDKRANAAKYYLADKFGVNLFRLYLLSYGERKAVTMSEDASASYAKQRRVHLKLWDKP